MNNIADNLKKVKSGIPKYVTLIAVSKTKPVEAILEIYNAGHRIFGENKVQEMVAKAGQLPKDIEWHLIGHLQSNKVKYIAPFVKLIHSIDSLKLLLEVDNQAKKNNRIIDCLLQIYIASEETKFGLSFEEAETLLKSAEFKAMNNVRIVGLMGMASNTENNEQVRKEFKSLFDFFQKLKGNKSHPPAGGSNFKSQILSMGMSGDYPLAIKEGSNMIRVGSAIFGNRDHSQLETN